MAIKISGILLITFGILIGYIIWRLPVKENKDKL